MATLATVRDLLDSLDYGKRTVERDIVDVLHARFQIPEGDDLYASLHDVPAGRVLAAILDAIRPFALMVRDVYQFLAVAAVRTEGTLEVRVSLDDANDLMLSAETYRLKEQKIVEAVAGVELDVSLLPDDGRWASFHDWYWPPNCMSTNADIRSAGVCDRCTLHVRDSFSEVTKYLRELEQMAVKEEGPPPKSIGKWEYFLITWKECTSRSHWGDCIASESWWFEDCILSALEEFRLASTKVGIPDLRSFLQLPYWRQRWQFYEVWFITYLLWNYGLANLDLNLDLSGCWRLAVGSRSHEPIAVSKLRSAASVEFFYQYQAVPPKTLYSNMPDRPEMLVFVADSARRQCLLAAEVKASSAVTPARMEAELSALRKWQPKAIVGTNYFAMGHREGIATLQHEGIATVAVDACAPQSPSTRLLGKWLSDLWQDNIGTFINIVLIDTSGSMPSPSISQAVSQLDKRFEPTANTQWLFATFSDTVSFISREELTDGAFRCEGRTDVATAIESCCIEVGRRFGSSVTARMNLHLLTDLSLNEASIQALTDWANGVGNGLVIYTWPSDHVLRYLAGSPSLKKCVSFFGDRPCVGTSSTRATPKNADST